MKVDINVSYHGYPMVLDKSLVVKSIIYVREW